MTTPIEALTEIEALLTNLQPHIDQACYPGHARFIDNYVDPALEIARAVIAAPAPAQPTLTDEQIKALMPAPNVFERDRDDGWSEDRVIEVVRAALATLQAPVPAPQGDPAWNAPTVEVWRGSRKVTIYPGSTVLQMQDPGPEFVAEVPHTLATAQAAMDWLYDAASSPAVGDAK